MPKDHQTMYDGCVILLSKIILNNNPNKIFSPLKQPCQHLVPSVEILVKIQISQKVNESFEKKKSAKNFSHFVADFKITRE